MSTESKITTGDQIKGLFSKPSSSVVTVETKKFGTLKITVKPMDNDVYARMGEVMKTGGIDLLNPKSDGMKAFSSVYYPAIKVVLPECCIEPKIIDGVSTDAAVLSVKDIPPEVCMDILNAIMDISGLGPDSEKEIKN